MNGKSNGEPPWMSLKRLVDTRMSEILRKEQNNKQYIRLYEAGGYWHAFDESAFQLSLIFEECETALFRHRDYPFPVIMTCIPDKKLRSYTRRHILVGDKLDSKKLPVPELSVAEYRSWRERTIKEFM